MPKKIRIIKVPSGDGLETVRSSFVGCEFKLADPSITELIRQKYFADLAIELPRTYEVTFAETLTGLIAGCQYECADYLRSLRCKPHLIRFPIDCARLIET